mgnify:CR=1 FL=1
MKDTTGNRRFLPLPINKNKRSKDPFKELTADYVNQLWAEAYQLYLNDEPLHITDDGVKQEAKRLQDEHTADDGLKGIIEEYIHRENLSKICARQIWHDCLMNDKEPKRHNVSDINEVLRKLDGWKMMKTPRRFRKYGNQRGFQKVE